MQPAGQSLTLRTSNLLTGTFRGGGTPGNTAATVQLADGQIATLTNAVSCTTGPEADAEPEPEPEVISVTIVDGNKTVFLGDTLQLTTNVATTGGAAPSVTWTSSDETIATIDSSGTINPAAEGRTTITAVSTEDSSKADSIALEVTRDYAIIDLNITDTSDPIIIPIRGNGTYIVQWGDGTTSTITNPAATDQHLYQHTGTYTLKIASEVGGEVYFAFSHPKALTAVESWGNLQLAHLDQAFLNASNLHTVPQHLPESVTSLRSTFAMATNFNQDLTDWDTTNITNMSSTFAWAVSFNGDIGSWNTQNVTSMREMFGTAKAFNQDLRNWNTGNVTDMSYMFSAADAFNGDITTWDIANVTSTTGMFSYASKFNQNLNAWDTSNIELMGSMFQHATDFNQDLNSWDTAKATVMGNMFNYAEAFDGDISSWDTQNVRAMSNMFSHAKSFSGDISNWDTRSVNDMTGMFANTDYFNSDIGQWTTAGVYNMGQMFSNAKAFDQDLTSWCVSQIPTEPQLFKNGTPNSFDGSKQPRWGGPC